MTTTTESYQVCPVCGYPSPVSTGCQNPACSENPALSPERRQRLRDAHERAAREEAEQQAIRRVRERIADLEEEVRQRFR